MTQYWRQRTVLALSKLSDDVKPGILKEAWIWDTNRTILTMWRNLNDSLLDLNCWLVKFSSSNDVQTKLAIEDAVFSLESRGEIYKVFFELEARDIFTVHKRTDVLEPPALDLDFDDLEQNLRGILVENHPTLKPEIRSKVVREAPFQKVIDKVEVDVHRPEDFMEGLEYFYGYGKVQNYRKAMYHFERAEKEGLPEASNALGKMYYEGKGVRTDYRKSYLHFAKSANLHDATGLYYLGKHYEEGKTLNRGEQDYAKAINLYEQAASLGHPEALVDLGYLYENGLGVP